MTQVVADHFGDGSGGGYIADAPAGHGVRLGHTVYQQGPLLNLGTDGRQAGKLPVVIGQAVVDLIRDHIDILLHTDLGNGLQLLAAVHHTGGVGGVVQNHALGLGGNSGSELLGGDLEVLSLGGLHHHGHAAHHLNELDVADPVGRGQDDLVSGVDQGAQRGVHAGLGAVGGGDLGGLVLHAAVLLQTLAHRLAHFHSACGGSVLGVVVAPQCRPP